MDPRIPEWLRFMVARKASDLFLTAGFPPAVKLNGKVLPLSKQSLTPSDTASLAESMMTAQQWAEFGMWHESNFAVHDHEIGRFRVNVYLQQGRTAVVMRHINTRIPSIESLHLPLTLKEISMQARGLVIVVGSTGMGKSSTLAAMLGYRNENAQEHIITVEDPIEFVHEHARSIVSQREIGTDSENWEQALKNTLRQAPDAIMIGEVRDREVMQYALAYAETGHLCLTTIHANNANQALDRILSFFPKDRRDQVLLDLSFNLRAIVSQRLVPTVDGKSRVPAVEIMLNSPLISDLVMRGRLDEIKEVMQRSRDLGMQTFDQSLYDLYELGVVQAEDALRHADSFNDLRLKIKLHQNEGKIVTSGGSSLDKAGLI